MTEQQFPLQPESSTEVFTQPIPEVPSVAGWKELPIHQTEKSAEELVPLGMFTEHRQILTSSVYDDEHENSPYEGGLEGGLTTLFVRSGVAERLHAAGGLLPRGYHLMAMDTYRPLVVQNALYEQYEGQLRELHPDWSDDEISVESQKYVSLPSEDPNKPSPHNTGGAVDVVIVRLDDESQRRLEDIDGELDQLAPENWQREYLLEMERSSLVRNNAKMLNFGTEFDHGSEKAGLRYYEDLETTTGLTADDIDSQANRRMLYHAMVAAGFEPYADEWWHFNDPATQMGAKVAGAEFAEYGAAELSESNAEHEEMRKLHRINTERLAKGVRWVPPPGLGEHYQLALIAAEKNDPTKLHPEAGLDAEKISPSK